MMKRKLLLSLLVVTAVTYSSVEAMLNLLFSGQTRKEKDHEQSDEY
jgi:hypothetical protein